MVSDTERLAILLEEIESQLDWGSAAQWTNTDFGELSFLIAESAGTTLSTSTLKRVWGRVTYTSQPSTTTLDALAVFAGYSHWRAYRGKGQEAVVPAQNHPDPNYLMVSDSDTPGTIPEAQNASQKQLPSDSGARRYKTFLTVGVASLTMACLAYLYLSNLATQPSSANEALNPDDYQLTHQVVTLGVPNSVIFNYAADQAPTDEVYFQQSWDTSRREKLDRQGHTHTSIYYWPGYYRTKLVVAGQIVQEQELIIQADEWIAAVDIDPIPVYLEANKVWQNGQLAITENQLAELGIALQPNTPTSVLTYGGPLAEIRSDDFTFSTRFRHDYATGSAVCQYLRVLLLLKNSAIMGAVQVCPRSRFVE